MWLPLALADLFTIMIAVCYRAAGETKKLKLPKRSEILKGWALPFMSEAVAADEEENEALELLRSVEALKEKNE